MIQAFPFCPHVEYNEDRILLGGWKPAFIIAFWWHGAVELDF